MPELPIGKLYPTLITIEHRYIFQIGGFDDYDYEIYCLDTENEQDGWREFKFNEEASLQELM